MQIMLLLVKVDTVQKNEFSIKPYNDQCSHYIEISKLICRENQLTGFYMIGTMVVKGLRFQ